MKVFVEEQRFNQWWLFLILIIPFIITFLLIFKNESVNSTKEITTSILITTVVGIIVFLVTVSIRLRSRIDEKGIYYQFFPINFKQKFIPWTDIAKCYTRKYSPITEYGGWGYRMGLSKGKAINIKGNIGIQLVLKNGTKLLVGTQKENEVERVLLTYKDKINCYEN